MLLRNWNNGAIFSIDFAMSCKKGRHFAHRHDSIRNLLAEKLQKVCQDVCIEPQLQPHTGESCNSKQIMFCTSWGSARSVRLVVKARYYWAISVVNFFEAEVPRSYNEKEIEMKTRFSISSCFFFSRRSRQWSRDFFKVNNVPGIQENWRYFLNFFLILFFE